MMSAVSIEGLTVRLDGRIVLEDIWLEVDERDFLGLIGPNGGGKSTLLKAILGLVKPSSGRIRVFGRDPVAARPLVGYLPQHSIFDQRFPVRVLDVVLMGRYPRVGILRRYRNEDIEAAKRALDAVGMLGLADREIGALSGGEQQRVFVARAIVSDPKLLLLDEPTAGVDVAQQGEFYDLLKDLNSRMAIIMVSHDLSAISAHVEKVACLNQRLYYHGSKELTEEDLVQAYGCPIVDIIAHGIPHRVLREHR